MNQVSPDIARLTAITALLGALIVILSQVVTAYSLQNELRETVDTVTLLSKHGAITAIFGLLAALAVVFAVATGNRLAAIFVIGMGLAVILVFLLVDVPDIGDTGMFNTEQAGNIDVEGKAAAGLWLELTGGMILVLAGSALAMFSDTQLREIGPGGDRSKSKASTRRRSTN
ncbi:MAG: hypothetical protein WBW62_01370 [Solirubrobacterales bacterium]